MNHCLAQPGGAGREKCRCDRENVRQAKIVSHDKIVRVERSVIGLQHTPEDNSVPCLKAEIERLRQQAHQLQQRVT